MACETLQFYGSICEVILKIHLIGEQMKVKFYENQQNFVSGYIYTLLHAREFFFVFFMHDEFHKYRCNSTDTQPNSIVFALLVWFVDNFSFIIDIANCIQYNFSCMQSYTQSIFHINSIQACCSFYSFLYFFIILVNYFLYLFYQQLC